jgi:DNA-binding NarL/FixJ family response regulator
VKLSLFCWRSRLLRSSLVKSEWGVGQSPYEQFSACLSSSSPAYSSEGTIYDPTDKRSQTLTLRETDVLDEVARGQSNKEAARTLGISPRTVEVHRARIMEKVGARNTADLMRIVLDGNSSGPAPRF